VVLGVLGLALAIVWWPGCRQYPPVRSRESLDLIKLVYTACNTKDAARLARAERDVEKLRGEGKLSKAEDEVFTKIIELGKNGEWAEAEKRAFRFAQDQIGAGGSEKD